MADWMDPYDAGTWRRALNPLWGIIRTKNKRVNNWIFFMVNVFDIFNLKKRAGLTRVSLFPGL